MYNVFANFACIKKQRSEVITEVRGHHRDGANNRLVKGRG